MKILVGSYNKNIYEVSIENEKFKETKIFKNIIISGIQLLKYGTAMAVGRRRSLD